MDKRCGDGHQFRFHHRNAHESAGALIGAPLRVQRKLRFRRIVCRIGAAALGITAGVSIDGFLSIIRDGRDRAGKKA
jgi:hypothetical protein